MKIRISYTCQVGDTIVCLLNSGYKEFEVARGQILMVKFDGNLILFLSGNRISRATELRVEGTGNKISRDH